MKFIADFHVHSKYSRATAKNSDLENLYVAAQRKGITVIGTGDFTHPAWWQEITQKLVPAEDGLLALKPEIAGVCDAMVPPACRGPVRFVLVTEISNIYKKKDRTRKNHNLVFMPDLDTAGRFNTRLDKIGNIRSDGRPILGLDARNLLEITLETAPAGFLVPAHIWTPWFSLLGSKSGFDSVDACFEDLTAHIFALETGLSSDPPMNWRVSSLDRFRLISNSDAHSPAKLGREANCFDTDLSYAAIRAALAGQAEGFEGTLEFFPDEGKYHVDGHSKCAFRCLPARTRSLGQCCPVCGKPMVLGVLYRVEELADRSENQAPPGAKPFKSLIPLEEILAEVFQTGAQTKRVATAYTHLLQRWGAELDILRHVPRCDLEQSGIALLGEAIERMRQGRVLFEPGYDGEYGRVRIFDDDERGKLMGQQSLFSMSCTAKKPEVQLPEDPPRPPKDLRAPACSEAWPQPFERRYTLNAAQQSAVDHTRGPLLIIAGPGTGKTRTITCRMAALITRQRVPADTILAVTFTNKAAAEMQARLAADLGPQARLPSMTTFHGLGRQLLIERLDGYQGALVDDDTREAVMADALQQLAAAGRPLKISAAAAVAWVVQAKQHLLTPDDDLSALCSGAHDPRRLAALYASYQQLLQLQNVLDFEDLIAESVRQIESDPLWCQSLRQRFAHIFVDEFQDINFGQYRLIRLLAPGDADLCVIGDPDQAIYGFRGSDVRFFERFNDDYPNARVVRLERNYRSTETILKAAYQVIRARSDAPAGAYSTLVGPRSITILTTASARAEAVAIGKTIEQMVGGTGFHAIDFGKVSEVSNESGFADFAVLCRTTEQVRLLGDVLQQAGIPCRQVSRQVLRQAPGTAKLLSLLRVMADQACYVDLNPLIDLIAPGISLKTLDMFKAWAYAAGLSLAQALRAAVRIPIPGMSTARQQRLAALVNLVHSLKNDCTGRTIPDIVAFCIARTTLVNHLQSDDVQTLIAAADQGADLPAFLAAQALQRDTDLHRPDVEKVALMTLHASKGLEFPVVFIAGCEQGLIPFHRPGATGVDLDEERRLFFVALTRAKERLYLSWARRRARFGTTADQRLSPFVEDIERRLKQVVAAQPANAVQQQLSLF
ncbi:MAG: hypothetical protein VR64_21605 [Desulfatitalea sp. BRH_c12]|nr:MAG: hypothetical protein VR64_21605 [Desulfatitalea sp. BRH_c12]